MPMFNEITEDPVLEFMDLQGWPQSPPIPIITSSSPASSSSEAAISLDRPPSNEKYLLGFLEAYLVGLHSYGSIITGVEIVSLIRKEMDPFDPNAIPAFNVNGAQVGYVSHSIAAVLAPLMDANLIVCQGFAKFINGRLNTHIMPCEIHVFAKIQAFGIVKTQLQMGGLNLIMPDHPLLLHSEAAILKERKNATEERMIDNMFKVLDDAISKEGSLEPLEPPSDVIRTTLFPHQKEALGWLVQRENSNDLPPFWEERGRVFTNLLTNDITNTRPDPFQGGMFADDMGLGKTLTLLSLIAFDKLPRLDEDSLTFYGEQKCNKKQKNEGTSDTSKGKAICIETESFSRTTLIVCPTSVFSAWIKQLETHTYPGTLKTYMYYGERTKDPYKLQKYDIVLTTYSTLATEFLKDDSPINKIEWWRIILDEAHLIKNAKTRQSKVVTSLNSKRRWVVTGTPIQNNSFDMFSLISFLGLKPLSTRTFWNKLIAVPLARGIKKGISRLQVLMATISLRRTKDKTLTGFPSKTIETYFVELSEEERDVYDKMEAEARMLIQKFITSMDASIHYTNVLSILIRLRQICVDLAICPNDFQDLPAMKDASKMPELLNKLNLLVEENDDVDLDCPVCINTLTEAVITSCSHIFCRQCIIKTLRHSKQCCPLCRRPLKESDLFFIPPDVPGGSKTFSPIKSSKVLALLKLLYASRDENPNRKSVIFSQFRKMLTSLEGTLKQAGFKVLRVDGSMTAMKRGKVIEEFDVQAPTGPTILLASLKTAGAGVNLTVASRVYLLEPWWNPAVEEQAMDRVHRIGQTEDVKVIRMIARNTVEEKILKLQENKKLLAKKAFGRKGTKEQREISNSDIAALMDLGKIPVYNEIHPFHYPL